MNYTPPLWLDIVRYIALGQVIMILVMIVVVVVRYTYIIKRAPKADRAMPYHVILISSSYFILLVGALVELHERIGVPPTWRTYLYPPAFVLGNVALIFLLVHISVQRTLVSAVLRQAQETVRAEMQEQHRENVSTLKEIKQKVEHVADVVEQAQITPS